MRQPIFIIQMLVILAAFMMLALVTSHSGRTQESAPPNTVGSFINSLIGEWVGTCVQSTDGKATDNKYFHAIVKQSGSDTYETVFEYYRLDPKTNATIKVGVTTMRTKVAADGTATNRIIGKADVLLEPDNVKPAEHDLTEVLSLSPSGMQGTGSGSIKVSGMPLGLGKNGKVQDYRSTWSQSNGVLTMSQQLKIKFKVLFFSKTFTIVADYTAQPGSDIVGLMKSAKDNANRSAEVSQR